MDIGESFNRWGIASNLLCHSLCDLEQVSELQVFFEIILENSSRRFGNFEYNHA